MKIGSINRNILRLALPSILANITVPLVGIVDLAIAGHLGDAASIGGIAIGSMLFDLLYWNMGFLRVGTGGITAQAYGRRDFREAMDTFTRGIVTALTVALLIWIIQWVYVEAVFALIVCSPEVERSQGKYFFIRAMGCSGHFIADGIQGMVYWDAEYRAANGCRYYGQCDQCGGQLYPCRLHPYGGSRCCRRYGGGAI